MPHTMSDDALSAERLSLNRQWINLQLADEIVRGAARSAVASAFLGLPEFARVWFSGAEVRVDAHWTESACAIANRQADIEQEWFARQIAQAAEVSK